ncbi:hypothetical protein ACWEKM_34150 [Streptomyces sp. NPDC004752]
MPCVPVRWPSWPGGGHAEPRSGGRPADWGASVVVPAGRLLEVGTADLGVRAHVAASDGIDVEPIHDSRSTAADGPRQLVHGSAVRAGAGGARGRHGAAPWAASGPHARVGVAPQPRPPAELVLRVMPGPRDGWFTPRMVADRARLRGTGVPGVVREQPDRAAHKGARPGTGSGR